MAAPSQALSFVEVDLKASDNNVKHHTDEASTEALIARRGQGFNISLKFKDPNELKSPLVFIASTGKLPDETKGTKVIFGLPDPKRSPDAKAIWKAALNKKESAPKTGLIIVTITPAADAPIGKYTLHLKRAKLNRELGTLTVLFNPWCSDDSVYLEKEEERQEYVMNESGIIYKGSSTCIESMHWDFGQFEDNMVEICLHLLNVKPMDYKDLAGDESSLSDPIYVSRVLSAMINSESEKGVLEGRWQANYKDGFDPMHWSGSYPILKRWFDSGCQTVKYGQCWVFAGVMCSVMRLLGIPCRVVTNYMSAVDLNKNLLIDIYHPAKGVTKLPPKDSLWNYHVWVEAWMKRPDLLSGCDGWQVLDATDEMSSDGVYCCGPASVRAVRDGLTTLDYDVPFVFAEVNADRVDWLVNADGSKKMLRTDPRSVGQKISTKSVGSNLRMDITKEYKYLEGSDKDKSVFKFATFLNDIAVRNDEMDNMSFDTMDGSSTIAVEKIEETPTKPKICMKFEEVSKPMNGRDVRLNLVLNSEAKEPRPLSINIRVTAQNYSGSVHSEIQSELKEDTLLPGKSLRVPVVVRFYKYGKLMLNYDVMKVSAIVSDTGNDSEVYLVEDDVVLVNPPTEIKALNEAEVGKQLFVEMYFTNPVNETLKNCTFTVFGSGLLSDEQKVRVPDIEANKKLRLKVCLCPYKAKQKTLAVDFNCSAFRDIKATLPIYVKAKAS